MALRRSVNFIIDNLIEKTILVGMEECSNCKFIRKPNKDVGSGWCQRYPPKVVVAQYPNHDMAPIYTSEHPWVDGAHWCGEFKHRMLVQRGNKIEAR